jgi:hypothetical protein
MQHLCPPAGLAALAREGGVQRGELRQAAASARQLAADAGAARGLRLTAASLSVASRLEGLRLHAMRLQGALLPSLKGADAPRVAVSGI